MAAQQAHQLVLVLLDFDGVKFKQLGENRLHLENGRAFQHLDGVERVVGVPNRGSGQREREADARSDLHDRWLDD